MLYRYTRSSWDFSGGRFLDFFFIFFFVLILSSWFNVVVGLRTGREGWPTYGAPSSGDTSVWISRKAVPTGRLELRCSM